MNQHETEMKALLKNIDEQTMDALGETLTWEYCHTNGKPLTDEELPVSEYDTFSRLLVHVNWINYPDQAHLIEAREARATAAKTRRSTPKKKPTIAEGEA